jgi:2-keto-4-pentenoate hydratase
MKQEIALSEDLCAFGDALLEARLAHRPVAVPAGFASRCSLAEGRAIGARNASRLAARLGGGFAGVKLGATNPAAMQKLGLERPFDGAMLSARVFPSPAALPHDDFIVCIVEAELGVRFGVDFGGSPETPSREALAAALDAVFPVIELAETRLLDWQAAPPAAIFADMAYFGALVTGAPAPGWRQTDLAAVGVRLSVNGEAVRQGTGAAVMGHPLDALAGYIAQIGADGRGLRAGEIVSTGTWTLPYVAQRGDRVHADFGALGSVEVMLG